MPDASWKRIEREVARLLEGKRVPASGAGAIKGDIVQMRLMPGVLGEAKHGKQVLKAGPKQLSGWLQEAERDAKTAGSLGGMVVLHPERKRVKDSLVVMRLGLLSSAMKALEEQTKLFKEDEEQ